VTIEWFVLALPFGIPFFRIGSTTQVAETVFSGRYQKRIDPSVH